MLLRFLPVLLFFFLHVTPALADGICACYYTEVEHCESFTYDASGNPFADQTACDSYCDSTFNETLEDTDWADDSEGMEGVTVADNCEASDEAAEATGAYAADAATPTNSTPTSRKLLTPVLSVDIPTVTFTDAIFSEKEGSKYISVNYLGEYIAGVYKYLLGISTTIAIVMIMVSGLQWTLGGQSPEAIGKAKTRIKNAVTGLVLLLSTYIILFTVNPNLLKLQFPELQLVETVGLFESEDDVVSGSVAASFKTPSSSNVYGAAKSLVPEELMSDIEAVASKLESQGYGLTITSGYRSLEEQKRQIGLKCNNPPGSETCDPKDGKTVACILKDNDPKNCPHTTGKALDIWGTKLGSESQCVTQPQCSPSAGANDPCRVNECQSALITAMKEQGFCNLSSEAWHFEKPKMSSKCN